MARMALATVSPISSRVLLLSAEMDCATLAVAQHLDLYMTRSGEVPFDIERVVAKRRLGFGARRRQRRTQFGFFDDHTHAAAAAACGRFEDQRIANLAPQVLSLSLAADIAV